MPTESLLYELRSQLGYLQDQLRRIIQDAKGMPLTDDELKRLADAQADHLNPFDAVVCDIGRRCCDRR